MHERSENVNNKDQLHTEKRILRLSLAGSLIFLLIEFIAVIITRSQAVLIDCVYDSADLLMLMPFIILLPKLYKPITEKWPYGFLQIEPLFVILRCCVLLCLDAFFIYDSVIMIMEGGHTVDASAVASFEFVMALACILIYLILMRLCKDIITPTIESELYVWKVDAYSTAGVGMAFLMQIILQHTSLGWIAPYVDPGIAIILAVVLLPEPIIMIRDSLKSLILVSPEPEVSEHIRTVAEEELSKYGIKVGFLDIVRTGRRTWADVNIIIEEEMLNLRVLKTAQDDIVSRLHESYEDIIVELIPDLKDIKPL